jgi:hypothetical protein
VEHLVPNDVFLLWMKRSHFVISLIPVSDQPCPASAGLFLATEFSSGLKAAAICCWRERASMIETQAPLA